MAIEKASLGAVLAGLALCGGLLIAQSACAAPLEAANWAGQPQQQADTNDAARVLGTITSIHGSTLTVQPDHGQPVTLSIASTARLLRLEPGQHSLAAATPIALGDIAVGDRVFARGTLASGTLTANLVVAMKHSDIAARQAAEEKAWEQDGVGGIVRSIDTSKGTIQLAFENKTLTVETTPQTSIRRYSQDSASFRDTQPATLAEIAPGDQLRALGEGRPADGTIAARVVVFGNFLNIAAKITAVDTSASTLTVEDLATRKPLTLAIRPDSQLRELPSAVAERLAMLLKMGAAGHEHASGGPGGPPPQWQHPAGPPQGPEGMGGHRRGVLAMATPISLAALHPGEAVLIVATRGTEGHPGTALTLLSGVEAMLHASTEGSRNMLSSSWSLGGGGSPGGSDGGAGPQS